MPVGDFLVEALRDRAGRVGPGRTRDEGKEQDSKTEDHRTRGCNHPGTLTGRRTARNPSGIFSTTG